MVGVSLFTMTDVVATISGPTLNPSINLFILVCGDTVGAALSWILLINTFLCGSTIMTVASRIVFAMSRDKAFPYSEILTHVHIKTNSPTFSTGFVIFWGSLLLLLELQSPNLTAFLAITGFTITALLVK